MPECLTGLSADECLDRFDQYLREVRGARPGTCRLYRRHVRSFLDARFPDAAVCDVRGLTVAQVVRYIQDRAGRCGPGAMTSTVSALRCFLRHLVVLGVCEAALPQAVPTVPRRHHATPPPLLSDTQVLALLESFDRESITSLRDYAVALCLVRLGLRAAEVAPLSLDDVDWRAHTLRLRTDKARRVSVLPLPDDVAHALAQYLQRGRPPVPHRALFVQRARSAHPGAPLTSTAVRHIIRSAWHRSGVAVPSRGTHALRHALASRLLARGATLKQMADILRHRSLDTTMIDAQVDWAQLADVVCPWPVRVTP